MPTPCSCQPLARRRRLSSPQARPHATAQQQVGWVFNISCTQWRPEHVRHSPAQQQLLANANESLSLWVAQVITASTSIFYCLPLPTESRPMTEAEDEISDDAMPQLPASVHVRKSSVACSKVRAACSSSARHPQLKRPASKQEHHACPHGARSTIVVCMPGCPASNNHAALLTTANNPVCC